MKHFIVMPTQNVNLTSELERFVKSVVASGQFKSASEVHRAALAEMARSNEERRLRLERLRHEIQKGLDSAAKGRLTEISENSALSNLMDGCFDRAISRLEAEDAELLS